MGNENGVWVMHGLPESDPDCIKTVEQLTDYINKVGFLPLFKNDIEGFSVEEHTRDNYWWSGDIARDPWEWREIIAEKGQVAYGKFFYNKAGFISKEWLPVFANHRRDGYDFDALWDDAKATIRQKKIMDCFDESSEVFSNKLKAQAGFCKGGEKNFDGVLTDLQMKTYLCVRKFQRRKNKNGEPFGWPIAIYCMPEHLWGYECLSAEYKNSPKESYEKIVDQMKKLYPHVTEKQLKKI